MRIAFEARPIRWAYGTGIGNYTYHLLKALRHLGKNHTFTFLWPDDDLSGLPFSGKFSHCAVGKIDRDEERLIPQWLQREKADVYHLPQNGLRFPKEKTVPVIVTVHDLIPYLLPDLVRRSYLLRFLDEMPDIIDRADLIVTVSECARQDIIRLFKTTPDKIVTVPSAPSPLYRPRPKEKCRLFLKRKYGIANPFILYVGGLNPRKNVAGLIWSYHKIRHCLPGHQQLVILGGAGRHREDLEQLAHHLGLAGDVVFPGFAPDQDLPFFYNAADLFVYPSLYEGFGLPPIEAMASGTPVITSDCSSLPEVTGDAALHIPPLDTMGLAEAMYQVLSSQELQSTLVQKGFAQAKRYRWSRIGQQMLSLYRRFDPTNMELVKEPVAAVI
ncbi:MAG TPA: glycosyltransferase family 4 protein [Firmicutes bacterium]|nr:glycosyltransferase family 4 protein [Bacillota bacterium]HOQ23533.1 glycosyltransferase family 1 protein [Bacillota bacterium]HPT67294.1 glycosyltransferase family 1 protein [Bacillota bacterium]